MKKILFLTNSEVLKSLVIKNKDYEFDFVDDEKKLNQILQRKFTQETLDYELLILDENVAETKLINIANLDVISFIKEQRNLDKIYHLSKPIHITDLFAKIAFLSKRHQRKIINLGNFIINFESRFVKKMIDDRVTNEIRLTELEAKILNFFLEHPEMEKTKIILLQEVWKYSNANQVTDTGIVEVTINKLRKKLKEIGIDELVNFKIHQQQN